MIAQTITFLLVNFVLTFFVLGLVSAGIRIARAPERTAVVVTGALLNSFLMWAIGVTLAWNFVVHSVFGAFSAQSIGWAQSPFQLELAFASLGLAIVGVLASLRGSDLRLKLAGVLAVVPGLWGAAGGHVYQLVVNGDTASNNAGLILWTDLLIPVVGLVALYAHHRARRSEAVAGRHEVETAGAPPAAVAGV